MHQEGELGKTTLLWGVPNSRPSSLITKDLLLVTADLTPNSAVEGVIVVSHITSLRQVNGCMRAWG